jgi:hypothetical protein
MRALLAVFPSRSRPIVPARHQASAWDRQGRFGDPWGTSLTDELLLGFKFEEGN